MLHSFKDNIFKKREPDGKYMTVLRYCAFLEHDWRAIVKKKPFIICSLNCTLIHSLLDATWNGVNLSVWAAYVY